MTPCTTVKQQYRLPDLTRFQLLDIGGGEYSTGEGVIARVPATGGEAAIADAIVESWMTSIDHKDTVLRNYWRFDGTGVALAQGEDTVWVYATQYYC